MPSISRVNFQPLKETNVLRSTYTFETKNHKTAWKNTHMEKMLRAIKNTKTQTH